MIAVTIPLRTQSESNMREHPMARHRRRASQRQLVALHLAGRLRGRQELLPALVTLTRIAPRKLDGDNLQGSCKAIRDEVAKQLGIDDGDEEAAVWHYAQRKATAEEAKARKTTLGYGVSIEIGPTPAREG